MKLTLSGQTAINLSLAVSEMDIGYQYREFLSRKIQGLTFTSPFKCDGYGEQKNLKIRLLCEFKKDRNLKNRIHFAEVLSQAIYYVKKFELSGLMLPTVILLGDRDEWCVLHTNEIIQYLAMPFDWDIAPSDILNNKELIDLIVENDKINPFIFSVEHLDDAIEKIKNLTDNVKRLIPITNHNLNGVFNYFLKNILGKSTLKTNELANLFIQILVNPTENYLHPINKVGAIVTKNFNQVPIKNRKSYQSFFEHFKSDYTPREKEILTSILDRLVEDATRRKQGEFFTPTIWADKAHEYITSVFGEDWKEKYVVWDPAWGTGNLTRDYKFKELYCSTLNQSDIDTANQMGYNSEAIKFQFDFLNDPDEKLPQVLRNAIESGREIIIFVNPPYGRANEGGLISTVEKNSTTTVISQEMINHDWGKCSAQLYAQYIYRINKLSEKFNLALFSPALLFAGDSFEKLRNNFFTKKKFNKGFMMNSKNFADVSEWPITFSIFSQNINSNIEKQKSFEFDVLEIKDFEIVFSEIKKINNSDDSESLTDWLKESTNDEVKISFPNLSSPLNVKEKSERKLSKNSFGWFSCGTNTIERNSIDIGIWTAPYSHKGTSGYVITKYNFNKCISAFTCRSLITADWKNKKDYYFKPNENTSIYPKFVFDSLVYSIFTTASNQSSLRQITYKEKLWDIKNEFFWMSKEEMLNLANENSFTNLYNDARTDSNRYVYKLLFGEERIYDKLSPDAKLVLDKATELVKKSMSIREEFSNHENHLSSWDAGYAQLKLLWKEHYAEDFKQFRELYKNLEDRMRPLVYELGFLIK